MNPSIRTFLVASVVCFSGAQRLSAQCEPPEYGWTGTFGDSASEQGHDVAVGTDGSVLVTGRFGNGNSPKGYGFDFDPTEGVDIHRSRGGIDVFITKLNADGSYGWTRTIGGGLDQEGQGIAVDNDGNVLVSGHFYGTVDFDPTEGEDIRVSNGILDIFVTKLRADGSYAWSWTVGGEDQDVGRAVAVDSDGNVIVAGYFRDAVDFDPDGSGDVRVPNGAMDIFVTKLGADGSYAWTYSVGGTGFDTGYGVTTAPNGDVLVTGLFSDVVNFDPRGSGDVRVSSGALDIFAIRLASDGSYKWGWTVGGASNEHGEDVAVDGDNAVVIAGTFGTGETLPGYAVDFDSAGEGDVHVSHGAVEAFVTSLLPGGSYGWTHTFGGVENDVATGIATDDDGNVLIAGYFRDVVDFDPTGGTDIHESMGERDIFLTKLDADSSYHWTVTMGGAREDQAHDVSNGAYGGMVLTGHFQDVVDFDPGEGVDKHKSNGQSNVFITKFEGAVADVQLFPESLLVIRGRVASGELEDLFASDDSRMVFHPGITQDPSEPPVWLELTGTSSTDAPCELRFTLEARVDTPGVMQRIELYNTVTDEYEEIDARVGTRMDSVVEVTIDGDPTRFINPETLRMRAQLTWQPPPLVLWFPWSVGIDQAIWTVTP